MIFILYAMIAMVAGVIPWLHFGRRHLPARAKFIAVVVSFVLGLFMGYLAMPHFVGPFMGMTLSFLLFGAISAFMVTFLFEILTLGTLIYTFIGLVCLMMAIGGSPIFRSADYRALLGEVEDRTWEEDETPADTRHILVVSQEQAVWLGNKAIGQASGAIGSRFIIGDYHKQRVQGELYWVAPLEFKDVFKWWGYKTTPGYVMVSAEDRNRSPKLMANENLKIMPSAYFGSNLKRSLYTHGYASKGLTEYSFELDDNLHPYWVITIYHPSITYFGPVVDGIVILDPETEQMQYHPVGDIPAWVDRVFPEDFVGDYLTWYGRYVHGWWNSLTKEENVEVPTPYGGDPNAAFLVWGTKDQEPYWFTGITSSSSQDQSLTGLMMVNTRTGKTRRYRTSGPNEEAVINAVNSAITNYTGWRGTQPILYNIGGEKTWVVPVVSNDNIFQRIAMVRLSNATVTLGTDVQDAVRNYRASLATSGFTIAPSAQSGMVMTPSLTVSRKSSEVLGGKSLYYLYFNALPNKVFTATSDISPELPITEVGEKVTLGYMETMEPTVQLSYFDNEELVLRLHKEQQDRNERDQ